MRCKKMEDKIIGIYPICNCWSLCIYDFIDGIEQYIIAGIKMDNDNKNKKRRYKIHYNNKGNPYFNFKRSRIYFKDILKV